MALAVAFVLAAGLSACGGDDSSTDPGTTSSVALAEPSSPSGDPEASSESAPPAGDETSASGSDESAPADEGERDSAPGFRDTSGVTDIPAYGTEAGESLRSSAEATLNDYLEASRESDFEKACTYLLAEVRRDVMSLAAKSDEVPGGTCTEGLSLLPGLASAGNGPYYGPAKVASLRFDAPGGFVLFHGNDGVDYWMAMRLEDGWQIISTIPQPLEPEF